MGFGSAPTRAWFSLCSSSQPWRTDQWLAVAEGESEDTAEKQHRPMSNTEFSYCFSTKHVVLCCLLLIIHWPKSVSQIQQNLAWGTLLKTQPDCYITHEHAVGLLSCTIQDSRLKLTSWFGIFSANAFTFLNATYLHHKFISEYRRGL